MKRTLRKLRRVIWILQGKDLYCRPEVRRSCERHGSDYGGWHICPEQIDRHSIVYSFGVGEDVSFDLSLIERYGLQVHAFDPTPKSIRWVESQPLPNNFIFHDYGVADYDGEAAFYPPENPAHVSHTMLPSSGGPARKILVKVHRLVTIMKMLGHQKIDILKMDIEGAEYAVLADLLNSDIEVSQILVEFHHRFNNVRVDQTRQAIKLLNQHRYRLFHVAASGEEYAFIRE